MSHGFLLKQNAALVRFVSCILVLCAHEHQLHTRFFELIRMLTYRRIGCAYVAIANCHYTWISNFLFIFYNNKSVLRTRKLEDITILIAYCLYSLNRSHSLCVFLIFRDVVSFTLTLTLSISRSLCNPLCISVSLRLIVSFTLHSMRETLFVPLSSLSFITLHSVNIDALNRIHSLIQWKSSGESFAMSTWLTICIIQIESSKLHVPCCSFFLALSSTFDFECFRMKSNFSHKCKQFPLNRRKITKKKQLQSSQFRWMSSQRLRWFPMRMVVRNSY